MEATTGRGPAYAFHYCEFPQPPVDKSGLTFGQCIYTVLVVFMQIVATADTNLMLPEEIPTLTPESIQSRIYGSKFVLLVEQCMITTQWGCKICVLLIYHKLTYVTSSYRSRNYLTIGYPAWA